MKPKQIIKALAPFAALADAFETTRDGPWVCETVQVEGKIMPGCGRRYSKQTPFCPYCHKSPESQTAMEDILIDVAGLKISRSVWLVNCRKARSIMNQLIKEDSRC